MKWSILILFFILNYINCYGELNETEVELCYNQTEINDKDDCLNISKEFKTIVCCFYNMTEPEEGYNCVPIEQNSKGKKGKVDSILPPDVNIKGDYTCYSHYLTYYSFLLVLMIFVYTDSLLNCSLSI